MFINRLIKTFQERGRPDPEDVCFPCCIAAGFSPAEKKKKEIRNIWNYFKIN